VPGTGRSKVTLARTWWHNNIAHLKNVPPELAQKPDNLDWARFLGQVKWRDYDPKQYANFRAYLEFGGGQVTDLFTHWIDVVHMFLDQDIPVSAVAAGGVYHYKDGRTAPDTVNVLLVLIGHRFAQASHLGNIAYVQKRRLRFDPVREEILPV
jgi:Oxidoreductase family, C-terminal alpha/beta domain